MTIGRHDIFILIDEERTRQLLKWGQQRHLDSDWYIITAEEFGEIAKAILQGELKNIQIEIIQTIACLVGWLEEGRER